MPSPCGGADTTSHFLTPAGGRLTGIFSAENWQVAVFAAFAKG